MHKQEQALNTLLAQKLLPLYYHDSAETSVSILRALYAAGIRILEYTNRGPEAVANFKQLRTIVSNEMPDLQLGIGTVKSTAQATDYIESGADFIVAPSINAEVGKLAQQAGLLWVPGCMTPTEIAMAENAGASIVKIFPGNLLGPSYITSIKDLFPELKFIVTGGVEAEEGNLKAWFKSGVVGVGMGSKLISKERINNKAFDEITGETRKVMQLIAAIA